MGYNSPMPKGVYFHKSENYPPSRKGVKLTDEHKRKVSLSLIGNKRSLGHKNSEETNRLKSVNSARYWLGKKRGEQSLETIAKRSKSLTGIKRPYMREISRKLFKGKFGKEHPAWKEVKKRPYYKAIRQLHKYRDWRNTVFARDNYTCVLCKAKGYIEADHYPVRFVDILRKNEIGTVDEALDCVELWDSSNGRTLCKPCHLKTISWGRKAMQ